MRNFSTTFLALVGPMALCAGAAAAQTVPTADQVWDGCGRDAPVAQCLELAQALIDAGTATSVELQDTYFIRGLRLHFDGDYARAIEDYTESLGYGESAGTYYNRAMLLHHNGDLAPAIADLERAVELDTDYGRAWVDLGRAYGDAGRFQDAIDASQTALERDFDLSPRFQSYAWFNIGNNALRLDQDELALSATLNAVTAYPENAGAYRNLVRMYATRGEKALAQEAFDAAERLEPGSFHLSALRSLIADM